MNEEHNLLERLSKAYISAHAEFLERRSTAILFTVLLVLGLVICFVVVMLEDRLWAYFKVLSGVGPLIVALGVAAFWLGAFSSKIRLEQLKTILEEAGYLIARKKAGDAVKIVKGPLDQLSNYQYFDSTFIEALKSGKIKTADLSGESYLVAPFGRITKRYVSLFS